MSVRTLQGLLTGLLVFTDVHRLIVAMDAYTAIHPHIYGQRYKQRGQGALVDALERLDLVTVGILMSSAPCSIGRTYISKPSIIEMESLIR